MEQLNDPLATNLIDAKTLSLSQERVKYLTENPPSMICVNVVLNGTAALKHLICKEIIVHASNVSDQDADWYILRSGAERELLRLATITVEKPINDQN
jgi:hypothetical protein